MIITNSTEKPSYRLIEVVKPYFESCGFDYQMTKKEFQKSFEVGTKYVGFWFRIGALTSASLNWRIKFEKLEKALATIVGNHKNYKSSFTIGTDLANYSRHEDNPRHTFTLYDETTFNYDDFSINIAAEKLIEAFEKYTLSYFERFKDYSSLFKFYSSQEWRQPRELILAKYLSIPTYENLKEQLQIEVYNRKDKAEISMLGKTIEFLDTHDLKCWLD